MSTMLRQPANSIAIRATDHEARSPNSIAKGFRISRGTAPNSSTRERGQLPARELSRQSTKMHRIVLPEFNAHASSQITFEPYSHAPETTNLTQGGANPFDQILAAGAKVSLRPALPFPRLLLPLPDRIHTPRNTSAISL